MNISRIILHNTSWETLRTTIKHSSCRHFSLLSNRSLTPRQKSIRSTGRIVTSIVLLTLGMSYAAVPLYRLFCLATGYGGTTLRLKDPEILEKLEPVREREIIIRFNADKSASMEWDFKPHQHEIKIVPGETALAFYSAHNRTSESITGISTYNVLPFEAGQYFIKIQCFCFEEQILNPGEAVDMPVFFYIDPEFMDDPAMMNVNDITLSYTFFKAKPGESVYYQIAQMEAK